MNVDDFDFGAEDARYLNLNSEREKRTFLSSFVIPPGFRLGDFLTGKKYFVYGSKGAGKSALLQYIKLKAQATRGAEADFYYFQSAFSKQQLDVFRTRLRSMSQKEDSIIDDTVFKEDEEIEIFWRVFLYTAINKLLRKKGVDGEAYSHFVKALEAAKTIARAEKIQRKYPALKQFHATLARDPRIEIEGDFEHASTDDFHIYLDIAAEKLEEIYLRELPIYLFVDEMEVYKGDEAENDSQLLAISSLVRAVRDFNERFSRNGIIVIAAVRTEVVTRVSEVLYEVHRVVRDRGVEISWHMSAKHELHPLEKAILGRLVVQDDSFTGYNFPIEDSYLYNAQRKYFTNLNDWKNPLRGCLDLTWYRPRDMAVLFEEASKIDAGRPRFLPATLTKKVVKHMGQRLWQDAKSGLGVKYSRRELDAIDRVLRGGKEIYEKDVFFRRVEDLADMYDDVALLSDRRWIEVLEDLYRAGVVYYVSRSDGRKNFYFRGDEMPSFTKAFRIGVHQTLKSEFSLVKA